MELERLQEVLRYRFGDRRLLIQSMTHTSYGHEFHASQPIALRDNERLEFLGDAILDVVVSDLLLEHFPASNEGQLSKMRAALVNEKTLAEMTRGMGLPGCLRLGKGEIQTGGRDKPSILSSAFEALIAAIYLDGGFHGVYPVVRHLFVPLFGVEGGSIVFQDHKTRLQEVVQAKYRVTPNYTLTGATGPDHAKIFTIEVRMKDRLLAASSGSSKKEAEQKAAEAALEFVLNDEREEV